MRETQQINRQTQCVYKLNHVPVDHCARFGVVSNTGSNAVRIQVPIEKYFRSPINRTGSNPLPKRTRALPKIGQTPCPKSDRRMSTSDINRGRAAQFEDFRYGG